jgi:hypothetical protein
VLRYHPVRERVERQGAVVIDSFKNAVLFSVLCIGLATGAIACGGGDDEGDSSSGGDSGAGGQSSSAGAGGASAGAGGSGSGQSGAGGATATAGAGGAGGSMAAPVPCGSAECQGTGRFLSACCFDEAASKCGTMIAFGGDGMCNENVDPDPRCDSVMSSTITIPSCCTEDNRCGISFAMFGMPGCTSLEEAAMIAMGDGGTPSGGGTNPFMVTLPPPKACE